jgi:seryl-tRNA synthetase
MLDIKLIREQPDLVHKNLEKRRKPEFLEMLENVINKDEQWRKLKIEVDNLRQKRNQMTDIIKNLKKEGKQDEIKEAVIDAKKIPEKIALLEEEKIKVENEKNLLLLKLPNLLHETVPYGEDDSGNVIEKTNGDKPKFNFNPKSHVDLVDDLNGADIQRAAKTSGARFYFLKNDL